MEEDDTTLMLRIIEKGEVVPALHDYNGLSRRRHVKAAEKVGMFDIILGRSNF